MCIKVHASTACVRNYPPWTNKGGQPPCYSGILRATTLRGSCSSRRTSSGHPHPHPPVHIHLPRLSTTPAAPSRGELPRPPYPASPPYPAPPLYPAPPACVLRRATLCISCAATPTRAATLYPSPPPCAATLSCTTTLTCAAPVSPLPLLLRRSDRYSLDLMSHDKMHHSSTCHPASCLRLLKYLALFRVLKSVGAAPFPETPSSPAAGVADGNGFRFRDATFSQRADALTRQFLAMESLWPPVTEVTGATPMVFFHQRKAGGSSIRAVLHGLCTDANLHCFIICYDGINCDTYTLPTKGSPSAVYAGHIPWGEPQNKFERYPQAG